MTKRTAKSGTISPKAGALANTTNAAGPASSVKANMENGVAKNNGQNSQTLPQTGENESKVAIAVAGLLAAGIGLFALAIDRKRSK
ncbi:MAG: LPXTG cell wall anchor domain-containing protein [Lactobacillus sp.]